MKVTTQTLDDRQVEVAIEVEDERVQQALQRTARQIAQQVNIPGFRKGKAPYSVVVRAVGEQTLYNEMFKELGPQVAQEALEEAGLVPYRPVEPGDMQLKPLSFKLIVPLAPIVELGDYNSLRAPFRVPPVSEDMINQALEALRQRNTTIEPAGDGPAEWGHIAVLTIDAITEDGQVLDLRTDESGTVSLALDQQQDPLLPGFAANVVGMRVDEEKSFSLTFPSNLEEESLRGQGVNLTVKLVELKKLFIPPLDDSFAQTVGSYDTLDQLRAILRQAMEQSALAQAEEAYAEGCIDQLAQAAKIEFPPVMTEEELDRMLEETTQRLQGQKMSLAEFLNLKKQTEREYRDEMRPRAVKRIRRGLALRGFVEAEGFTFDEEKDQDNQQVIAKVITRLVSICKGEAGSQPAEEAATRGDSTLQAWQHVELHSDDAPDPQRDSDQAH